MDPQDIIDDIGRVCGIEYPTLSAIKSGYAVDAQREVCRRLEPSLLAPLPQCNSLVSYHLNLSPHDPLFYSL